jgi:hypothetical protein
MKMCLILLIFAALILLNCNVIPNSFPIRSYCAGRVHVIKIEGGGEGTKKENILENSIENVDRHPFTITFLFLLCSCLPISSRLADYYTLNYELMA